MTSLSSLESGQTTNATLRLHTGWHSRLSHALALPPKEALDVGPDNAGLVDPAGSTCAVVAISALAGQRAGCRESEAAGARVMGIPDQLTSESITVRSHLERELCQQHGWN